MPRTGTQHLGGMNLTLHWAQTSMIANVGANRSLLGHWILLCLCCSLLRSWSYQQMPVSFNAKDLAVPELQIAEEFNIAVLYTNPVMSDPGAGAMFVVRLCTEYSCRQRSPALTTLCHQHLTLTYLP